MVIWQEALTLVKELAVVTRQLQQKLIEDSTDFVGLLDRREAIMVELDRLKEVGGISSWTGVVDAPSEIEEISAVIARMFRELLAQDDRIRRIMTSGRDKLRDELTSLRAKKTASRAYQGSRLAADGIFIDSRR